MRYIFYVLIVVSAVVSAVALLGALIVGYSTNKTIAGLPPKRDANAQLTAFPADIEAQIKKQSMVSTGVAVVEQPQDEARQLAESLRATLSEAAGEVPLEASAAAEQADLTTIAAKLEQVLLDQPSLDTGSSETVRDYALRQLSSADGTVVLPHYSLEHLADISQYRDIATQLSQLQQNLNEQVSNLPELKDRNIAQLDIQVKGLDQLEAAVEALDLQSDLFGLAFDSSVRYDSLQALGEQLLGGQANLEGLDMSELEAISRDIVSQLGSNLEVDHD